MATPTKSTASELIAPVLNSTADGGLYLSAPAAEYELFDKDILEQLLTALPELGLSKRMCDCSYFQMIDDRLAYLANAKAKGKITGSEFRHLEDLLNNRYRWAPTNITKQWNNAEAAHDALKETTSTLKAALDQRRACPPDQVRHLTMQAWTTYCLATDTRRYLVLHRGDFIAAYIFLHCDTGNRYRPVSSAFEEFDGKHPESAANEREFERYDKAHKKAHKASCKLNAGMDFDPRVFLKVLERYLAENRLPHCPFVVAFD